MRRGDVGEGEMSDKGGGRARGERNGARRRKDASGGRLARGRGRELAEAWCGKQRERRFKAVKERRESRDTETGNRGGARGGERETEVRARRKEGGRGERRPGRGKRGRFNRRDEEPRRLPLSHRRERGPAGKPVDASFSYFRYKVGDEMFSVAKKVRARRTHGRHRPRCEIF
ncbi:hypothetical protein KM043_000850 [Ampulex compressa]|nr:hypothetical protein KM043_000850 [Ampulex compressa]